MDLSENEEEVIPYELDEHSDNEIIEDEDELSEEISSQINLILTQNGDPEINKLTREIRTEFYEIKKNAQNNPSKLRSEKDTNEKKFLKDEKYYRSLIFNGTIEDLSSSSIKLELVDSINTPKLWDIWKFFRNNVSSMKQSQIVGLQMYYLVKETSTNKYIGIISLSSDFSRLKPRDEYIGWKLYKCDIKFNNLRYLMNISTCVPLQPFGFNFAGGKLLAMLVFSREVSQDFYNKLSKRKKNPKQYKLLGFTTTSLYGKGVQYSKLKQLKYLGKSSGWTTLPYPNDFYEKCKELCVLKGIDIPDKRKHIIFQKLFPKIGIKYREMQFGEYKRGVYFGTLYDNSLKLLGDKSTTNNTVMQTTDFNNLSTVDDIFKEWMSKWGNPRYNRLRSSKKIIRKINLYMTKNEKNRGYQETFRKKELERLGKKILPSSEINIQKMIEKGVEERKKKTNEYYKSKKRYEKKTFDQKYDISKLDNVSFIGNPLLLEVIPNLKNITSTEKDISNKDLAIRLNISYDSLRTILSKCKI